MACPYFEPLEPHGGARRTQDSMLPLGRCWQGACHAEPGITHLPSAHELRAHCNLGYARGACSRFPADAAADAVRFTIQQDDGGQHIRLYHVIERDHLPFAHGPLEYRGESGVIEGAGAAAVALQALAYVRSYLHLKAESSR